MKLCVNCKHIITTYYGRPMCNHPKAPIDPVTGMKYGSCSLLRSQNCLITPACGPEGDWFEPKPAEETSNV